jgi:hypothetical protein
MEDKKEVSGYGKTEPENIFFFGSVSLYPEFRSAKTRQEQCVFFSQGDFRFYIIL